MPVRRELPCRRRHKASTRSVVETDTGFTHAAQGSGHLGPRGHFDLPCILSHCE